MRTTDAAARLGLSYRQLDHLARTGIIDLRDGSETPGSGSRRTWDDDTIEQLVVAVALNEVLADGSTTSALPSLAAAAVRAGRPPRHGWALYVRATGSIVYAADIADLAEALAHIPGAVAARYNLDTVG